MTSQIDPTNFNWKSRLLECLNSTQYMALATKDTKNGSWVCPVYFAWDESHNLYFISLPDSQHMQNIQQNSRVAVAIYSTNQNTHGDVLGLQLSGTATEMHDKEGIKSAYSCYSGRLERDTKTPFHRKVEEFLNEETDWIFVKVSPDKIFLLDSSNFGENRILIPKH